MEIIMKIGLYFISIFLVITANILYHIFQKAISSKVDPIISLIITYIVAALVSIIIYIISPKQENIINSLKGLNWASYALGIAIIGLEMGFLLAYRAGWNMSIGVVTSNIIVSLLLIPVGFLFFGEKITLINFIGIIFCIGGLALVNYK
jgi:drug/metabolite transporter (DMT)-like permease